MKIKDSTIKFYKDSDRSYMVSSGESYIGTIGCSSEGQWRYIGYREHADIVAKVNELNGD